MAIRTFQLLFEPSRTGPLPDSARARIALGACSRDKDAILVSAECRTAKEIEEAVNELKEDLDRVLAEARQKFAKERTSAA